MPIASYQSQTAALAELRAELSDDRLLDLCLSFRRKTTGEVLWTGGGRWDPAPTSRRFIEPDPPDLGAIPIDCNENQIQAVRHFVTWIDARMEGRPRKRILALGGNRRGGKSWIIIALSLGACVAIPGAIVYLVSPTLDKRDELEKYIKSQVPPNWRRYLTKELRFVFPNGSSIKNVTGDDADAIKRGEADLIVLNEPQLMAQEVFENAAPAIIDSGGLILLAGNPARKRKGVWFTRLVKLISEKPEWRAVGDFARLDARDNPDIDSGARRDIGGLLRELSPEAARADDEGIFLEPGNFAYAEHFDEKRNTVPTFPDLAPIITPTVIRRRAAASTANVLVGCDFQGWPFNVAVELVAVGDPAAPTWYVRRVVEREDDEDYLLDEMHSAWDPARTLVIGDASGTWQDAKHIRGRASFDKFKARHWRIEPPQKKQSDRGEYPANPPIEDRINLVNRLLDEGRLIVCLDAAKGVAEDFAKCEVDPTKGRPRGRHAHRPDAIGYALWWGTPRPRAAPRIPQRGDVLPISLAHNGPRIL